MEILSKGSIIWFHNPDGALDGLSSSQYPPLGHSGGRS
jgi:hypothetical protein